jgi:hypothetical protein
MKLYDYIDNMILTMENKFLEAFILSLPIYH